MLTLGLCRAEKKKRGIMREAKGGSGRRQPGGRGTRMTRKRRREGSVMDAEEFVIR